MKTRRSPLAQSRIDYIVFGNPKQVSKLVYDYGYVPPKSLPELSDAVHELINKRGRKVVVDLVKLHPDKEAILSILGKEKTQDHNVRIEKSDPNKEAEPEAKKAEVPTTEIAPAPVKATENKCTNCGKAHSSYDSYCGCSHSYNEASENLSNLSVPELRKRFIKLTEQSETDPQNKKVADEATRVWNEIRLKNQTPPPDAKPSFSISHREGLVILLLTIIAGVIIGYSTKTRRYHANS